MQQVGDQEARRLLFLSVALAYGLVLATLPFGNVSLDLASLGTIGSILAGVGAFWLYAAWRRMHLLLPVFECLLALFLVTVPMVVSTYVAIGFSQPLTDVWLHRADLALGFDWWSFVRFVDARPWLADAFAHAYSSFSIQLMALPLLLCLLGDPVRARALIAAYGTLCLAASLISVWFPAVGAYVLLGVERGDLAAINAHFGYFFLEQFHSVREADDFLLKLDGAAGILTFPSVHAGVAALCAWAAWRSRVLRWPLLALNVAMALSAISHGSHYLVDVIAGVGLAAFCVALVKPLFWRETDECRSPVMALGRRVLLARSAMPSRAAASD